MTHNQHTLGAVFKHWLPLGIAIVVLSGLAYLATQQNYRLSANDPQIQIAEDISNSLTQGKALPDNIVPPSPTTGMEESLSPFLVIYSATGTPIGSSVQLDNKIPTPPAGVYDYAKKHGMDKFTWEPKKGIRVAAVAMSYSGTQSGFLIVGRSLREIEKRERQLLIISLVAMAAALVLSFLAAWVIAKIDKAGHGRHLEAEHQHNGTEPEHRA
ncbi:MAG: hypothetical protein M1383_02235 [Patescibacteria group bacterium]|nr:hypothetical protein [Patescibacteria group bacterium]